MLCLYLPTPWSRVLEKLTGFQLVIFSYFVEYKGSLPHLQVSAICPYPEPVRSSPYPSHLTSWRFILSSHIRLGLPNGLFPSGFPTKTLYTPFFSPIRATCPAHLIILDFISRILLGQEYVLFPYFWHPEDRASWYILIMKANELHYFSDLFDKVLYMFRTGPLSIIRSISTLYARNMYLSF